LAADHAEDHLAKCVGDKSSKHGSTGTFIPANRLQNVLLSIPGAKLDDFHSFHN